MKQAPKTRREFLEFFGRAAVTGSLSTLLPFAHVLAQSKAQSATTPAEKGPRGARAALRNRRLPFTALSPSTADTLRLADGFRSQILITWGDVLNDKGDAFGFDNDYIAFFPSNAEGTDGVLWVNHELVNPLFVSGWTGDKTKRTREQIAIEERAVGGSLVRVRKSKRGKWEVVKNDPLNRRLDARTEIPLIAPREIEGAKVAVGTFANCAGGVTPWKTLLTCEENYHLFYGEAEYSGTKGAKRTLTPSVFGWENFTARPPEHYGWVVEVEPFSGRAKKLTALGRFAHESATCVVAKDGRCVVYSGDDKDDQCLYKFISDTPDSLESGTLHVADIDKGKWIPLRIDAHPALKKNFKDQLDVLIRCREAAALVGGSRLDRPEDVEIDPRTGAVYVACTNNFSKGRPYGSILKIEENANNPLALEFKASTFISGGPESGMACPDNLAFDKAGNLWFTTDVSGSKIDAGPYKGMGNNSLFYVPMSGPDAGRAVRVATAPREAELTGPCFSPDGRSLFLSVQHPGEESTSATEPTSHWPGGGTTMPKPSVVVISGPALDALIS